MEWLLCRRKAPLYRYSLSRPQPWRKQTLGYPTRHPLGPHQASSVLSYFATNISRAPRADEWGLIRLSWSKVVGLVACPSNPPPRRYSPSRPMLRRDQLEIGPPGALGPHQASIAVILRYEHVIRELLRPLSRHVAVPQAVHCYTVTMVIACPPCALGPHQLSSAVILRYEYIGAPRADEWGLIRLSCSKDSWIGRGAVEKPCHIAIPRAVHCYDVA